MKSEDQKAKLELRTSVAAQLRKGWPDSSHSATERGRSRTKSVRGRIGLRPDEEKLNVTRIEMLPYVLVPQRMQLMEEAINNRDFETFADITMQVSVLIPRMVRQQLTAEWFFYLGFFAVLFHRDSSF